MPHPESEHGLRVQLATALREAERLEGTLASAFGDLRESEKRADAAEEALAAARQECEGLRTALNEIVGATDDDIAEKIARAAMAEGK